MQEWMTSADGIKTLIKALKNVDNSTTFGFNTTGNAKTADKATNADKATTATNWNSSWNSSVQGIKVNNASKADDSITVNGVKVTRNGPYFNLYDSTDSGSNTSIKVRYFHCGQPNGC
jgi:hypothetical protein